MGTFRMYIFLIFSLTSYCAAFSQWTFGAEIAPASTWVSNNNNRINGSKSNFDFRVGIFGQKRLRNQWSLTAGLSYTFNSGGEQLYDFGGNYLPNSDLSNEIYNTVDFNRIPQPMADDTKIRVGLNFIEIPIGLKYEFQPYGFWTWHVIGPRISLRFLGKSSGAILAPANEFTNVEGNIIRLDKIDVGDENIRADIVPISLSWAIGGGTQYYINNTFSVFANLLYERSFTDLTKNNGYQSVVIDDTWQKNPDNSKSILQGLYLNLGILFNYGTD